MELDIQEIFKSDLDPNSQLWWSDEKINKINYNFRQVALGGMSGPAGVAGYMGGSGVPGVEGYFGFQGDTGYQGTSGPEAIEPWKFLSDDHGDLNTIFPKYNQEINGIETDAIRVVFSEDVITKGVQDVDLDGDVDEFDIETTNSPLNFNDTVLLLYTVDTDGNNVPDRKNLELRVSGAQNNTGDTGDFFLSANTANSSTLNIESNKIIYNSNSFELNTTDNNTGQGVQLANIDILNSNFNVLSKINNTVTVKDTGSISYSTNNISTVDNSGKILSSDDSDGNVSWKHKWEVLGTYPLGTIVSIPVDLFNSNNFHLNGTMNNPGSEYLKLIFGAGIEGTQYEGWYLANGKRWQNESGGIQHTIPNLNNFKYSISGNGDGQSVSFDNDTTQIIIGGIDYSVDCEFTGFTGTGSYNIDHEVDFSDVSFNLAGYQDPGLNIKKNIHLVYLRNSKLFWSTNDFAITGTNPINLSYSSSTSEASCTNNSNVTLQPLYQLSGANATSFNVFANDLSDGELYLNGQLATSGWYSNGTISRYWTGTEFSNKILCIISTEIQLDYNVKVTQLDGTRPVSNGNPYYINATVLKNATDLKNQVGAQAAAGWYKELERSNYSGVYYRRYWTGTQFLGETINSKYVIWFANHYFTTAASPCNDMSGNVWGLFAGFSSYPVQKPTSIDTIYQGGGIPYVYTNLPASVPAQDYGELPLSKVINQNVPGNNSSVKYNLISENKQGATYSTLNTTDGKFYQPSIC